MILREEIDEKKSTAKKLRHQQRSRLSNVQKHASRNTTRLLVEVGVDECIV